MRDTSLRAFLATSDAEMEMRQQLLMLGFDFDRPYTPALDRAILDEALQRLSRADAYFFPIEKIEAFLDCLARLLGTTPAVPERLNAADCEQQAKSVAEFQSLEPAVVAANHMERILYKHVRVAAEHSEILLAQHDQHKKRTTKSKTASVFASMALTWSVIRSGL